MTRVRGPINQVEHPGCPPKRVDSSSRAIPDMGWREGSNQQLKAKPELLTKTFAWVRERSARFLVWLATLTNLIKTWPNAHSKWSDNG